MDGSATPDLEGLERVLCRLPDVTTARVVADADGGIAEVHILSLPDKPAKQVVRDVQSAALAIMGIDVDRRVVSVVQLDAAGPEAAPVSEPARQFRAPDSADWPAEPANGRVCVEAVRADRSGLQCNAEVALRHCDRRAVGVSEGLMARNTVPRLVAQATVAALRKLEDAAVCAEVDMVRIVRFGDCSVAVTTVVVMVGRSEEILSGSAVVGPGGELDAVARSVLDATNRRLARLR
ncbi:MAG: hypothetical protein KY439_04125 [Actinobacteria bacterium]|nr:hypothetical protein [Actinomycetota bacterium]